MWRVCVIVICHMTIISHHFFLENRFLVIDHCYQISMLQPNELVTQGNITRDNIQQQLATQKHFQEKLTSLILCLQNNL